MSLNDCRDEAKDFMMKLNAYNKDNKEKIAWLEEEFNLLKNAVNDADKERMRHQIYDMLYLLFEMAADNEFDLDQEWSAGTKRKEAKYLKK